MSKKWKFELIRLWPESRENEISDFDCFDVVGWLP